MNLPYAPQDFISRITTLLSSYNVDPTCQLKLRTPECIILTMHNDFDESSDHE